MKKGINFFLGMFLIFIIASSCGSDDDACADSSDVDDTNTLLRLVNDSAMTYNMDPLDPNLCNDYKTSIQNYLDFVNNLVDCDVINQNSLNSNIESLNKELNFLLCN